ncbi:MAG: carbonic anhydrase family protein [Parasphingopyxis sp.]
MAQINVEALLPQDARHFLYSGSLTTRPCPEGVTSMVLDEPIQMSVGHWSGRRLAGTVPLVKVTAFALRLHLGRSGYSVKEPKEAVQLSVCVDLIHTCSPIVDLA